MAGYLFHTGVDQQIRRYVSEDDIYEILKAAHGGPCGGRFADKRTGHKVLQLGYYWPSIFHDVRDYVRRCDHCQRMGQPGESDEMPLYPHFGSFNPPYHQKVHILVYTNYVTKWVEARAVAKATEHVVADFLFEEIFA